ncbi:hybrid sensor histidine kinase/response regulator transcription factor [Desertivirga xinjiangensis]|uniref:hybrid sensor histidine kinase/response regulator transcription factor n=1 Tax=Desertivirga xinjiangensis TaxID=539206 RepID=UPI00210C146E|nr:two-component regulator propeller domain-containing protein [Pedobacter xinjiangensis]
MQQLTNHLLTTLRSFIILLLLQAVPASAQTSRLSFRHISIEEGLSQATVKAIAKDRYGFMWFGTRDGLNRYDGNKVTVFRNEIRNSKSIGENFINDIYEDHKGHLWIATVDGLDRFVSKTETFEHFKPAGSLTDIRDICEDKDGKLLLGTDKGLFEFYPEKKSFVKWQKPKQLNNLISDKINKLLLDKTGLLWVGTENGLFYIDRKTGRINVFEAKQGNSTTIQSPIIHELFEDSRGRIWIGMSEGGLALFDRQTESFKTYKADPAYSYNQNLNCLPHNDIRCMVENEPGVLWIGTENGGLCIFDTDRNLFTTFKPSIINSSSLSHDSLHSIYKDNWGNIWIGTWAGGVNFYSPTQLKFPLYNRYPFARFEGIESITRDSDGKMWFGVVENGLYSFEPASKVFTYYPNPNIKRFEVGIMSIKEYNKDTLVLATRRGGMAFFDKRNKTFKHYLPKAGDASGISGHELNSVWVDRNKDIWTGGWNSGLSRYDHKTKRFFSYKHNSSDPNSLSNDLIYTIFGDKQGRIWIGTSGGGLELYNPSANHFIHYRHQKGNLNSISHNTVISILEDHKGRFWVGTANGLNLMDRKSGTFKVFTQKEGLPNDVINGIVEDNNGNLWLGTNKGLCCFNPETRKTKNFGTSDGLQGNEFLFNACAKDTFGNVYFSGYKGLNIFNPIKLQYNTFTPPVVITDFLLFNKKVIPGSKDSPLSEHISHTKELNLNYDQSIFSFDFAALNFTSPEKNSYAYKLEGFEKDWNFVGSKHNAAYTNLDAGEYTFKVIAANNDGIWNLKGASVKIIIHPPFWETWWFRLIVIALIAYAIYRYLLYKRQQALRELEEKKKEEIHQVQLQFFTNISHEIRTPLTLILGPLEKLLSQSAASANRHYYSIIYRNANRLMHLINELMDFRKIESGALKLNVTPGNLKTFIEEIIDEFSELATERHIDYQLHIDLKDEVWFDRQVLEKILLNLIHNSFKYTNDRGKISVAVFGEMAEFRPQFKNTLVLKSPYMAHSYTFIKVTDSGIGISRDSINNLFQRYYRITDAHLGSGVGLAFVKSLAFLHKGQIFVSSERNEGTEIIIAIPSSAKDYTSEEKGATAGNEGVKLESIQYNTIQDFAKTDLQQEDKKSNLSRHLLIVDDNEELRSFLKDSLKDFYEISEASNGAEGLERSREVQPDLIISDVMMPDMNGLEFCKRVKEDIEISHIPFLMLTAKNSLDSEIEGIESGADFYFSKPVSIQLLQLTIRNIFIQKQKLIDHYNKDHHAEVKELVHTAKDKQFMDKLLQIIDSQLINPELDIELLCAEIGMSRTSLYQKIKSITGQPIGEFVRSIRLRKAIELMTHEDISISEVMFRVGIQSQSYFTKAFKKEFGKTPSQFLQELK